MPEVWEPMDHDNQWSLAYVCIVDAYSVIIRIMTYDVLVGVIGNDRGLSRRPSSYSTYISSNKQKFFC